MKVRRIRMKPRYILVCRGTGWGFLRYARKTCGYPPKPIDLKTLAWYSKVDDLCDQDVPWQDAIDMIEKDFA